jgi:hypothetical protein
MQAAIISELEGSTLLDDQQGCGPAFRVLKNLAQSWMDDASKRNNMWACTFAGARRWNVPLCDWKPFAFISRTQEWLHMHAIGRHQTNWAVMMHADARILCFAISIGGFATQPRICMTKHSNW